jgi:hypothetical protein
MIRAVLITADNYDSAKVIAGATGYEDAIPTDQDGLYACTIDVAYQCDECGVDNLEEENINVDYFFMVSTGAVWCKGCRQEFEVACELLFNNEESEI